MCRFLKKMFMIVKLKIMVEKLMIVSYVEGLLC